MKINGLILISLAFILCTLDSNAQCSVSLGSDIEVCYEDLPVNIGDDIDITADPGYAILWDNGLGSDENPSVAPEVNTTYTVTLSSGACVETASITVIVHKPVADAGPDVQLCLGSEVTLDGTGSYSDTPIFNYSWGPSFYVDSDQEDSPTPTIDMTSTGALQLTVTDANFCSDTDQITVIVNSLPNVDAGPDYEFCYDGSPIVQELNGSPSTGTWSGSGITDPDGEFTGNGDGISELVFSFTNFVGCTNTDTIEINIIEPTPVDVGTDFAMCLNDDPVQLLAGGVWSGTNVTAGGLFSPISVGDFTLTYSAMDGNCPVSDELTITVYDLPQVDAGIDQEICFGTELSLDANIIETSNPIASTVWSGGSFVGSSAIEDPIVNPVIQSTYDLIVTDSEGCQSSDDITVDIHTPIPVDAGSNITVCDYTTPETITLTGFSPLPGAGESAQWLGTGIIDPDGIYEYAGGGSHSLTYEFTDANNCVTSDDIFVTIVVPDVVDAGPDVELCLNEPAIQLLQPGTWSGTQVSSDGIFTPSSDGTFILDYEVLSGQCWSQDQIEIIVHTLPTADAGSDQIICAESSANLSGSGSGDNMPMTDFLWSLGENITNPNNASTDVTPTFTQSYTLTVTDSEGCQDEDQVEIVVNDLPIVDAGADLTLCDQPIDEFLTGFSPLPGAGETGVWSGAGITDPDGTFVSPGSGTYTLTYTFTDANACENSDDIEITVLAPVTADAGSDQDICDQSGTYTLVGFSPTTDITWSGPGITNALTGEIDIALAGTGTHTYTLEYGSGTCYTSDEVDFTIHELPTANAGFDQIICAESSTNLVGSGSGDNMPVTDYEWSAGENIEDPNSVSTDVTPTFTQSYTLTITDSEGCQNEDQVEIVINALPTVDAGADLTLCDQPIEEILTGFSPLPGVGETGIWTGTGITDPNGTFVSPGPGTYTLTYTFTDTNSCENSDEIEITVLAPVAADAGIDQEICDQPGTYTLVGFSPTTDVMWSGPGIIDALAGEIDIASAGVGTHTYTLEYGSGTCYTFDEVEFTVHDLPSADAGADQEICFGESALLSGGGTSDNLPILNYDWSAGENIDHPDFQTTDVEPSSSQSYILTVTDSKGCEADDSVFVTVNDLPIVDAGSDLQVCDQAIVEVLTGFSPVPSGMETGAWTGSGITDPDGEFTSPGIGTYDLTYSFTDGNGCESNDMIEIEVVAPVTISAGNDQTVCFGTPTYTLEDFLPTADVSWSGPEITDPLNGTINVANLSVGVYTYTIEHGSGTCYQTDEVELEVLALPSVNAGIDEEFCSGIEAFDLSGFSPSSGTWSGDGITDGISGTFDDTMGVTDYNIVYSYTEVSTGCSNSDEKQITIHPNPVADFDIIENQCIDTNLDIDNISSGADSYEWDFDGVSNTDADPVFQFDTQGDHSVELIAINAFNCQDTISHTVHIITVPTADFDVSLSEGCSSIDVDFTNNSAGEFESYFWDFDNTNTSIAENPPSETFVEVANDNTEYTVELTVSNTCGSDNHTELITVNSLPVADFTTDMTDYCTTEVDVDNLSHGNPTSFEWDWGDSSSSSSSENPSTHSYPDLSTTEDYTITLTVSNDCGSDNMDQTITIHPTNLSAGFSLDIDEGCMPLMVQVSDESVGAQTITYDFGNTDSSIDAEPSYEYTSSGSFTLEQTVTSYCDVQTTNIIVDVFALPTIDFDVNTITLCEGTDVEFENLSDPIDNLNWNFGDTESSTDENPSHTFESSGSYDVLLSGESLDNACYNEVMQTVVVNETPESDFVSDVTVGCAPLTVQFENQSSGADTYDWYFDDATSSIEEHPSHEFSNTTVAPASFFVTLLAENLEGCSHVAQLEIVVNPSPTSSFVLSDTESCDFPVTVSTTNNSIGAQDYEWNVTGNGTSTEDEIGVSLDDVGTYNFELIVSNEFLCTDTSSIDFVVHPIPVVNFVTDVNSGCRNLEVDFENNTVGADQYVWDFGDGSQSSVASPTHIYVIPGNFDVRLEAISDEGCADTLLVFDQIEVFDLPEASFSFTPEIIDIYAPEVNFTDESAGAQLYEWQFGDGGESDEINPTHEYSTTGTYQVILSVYNEFGCVDADIQELVITSDMTLYVPNAFSPDGDGINEVWKPSILGAEFATHYDLKVFNRWGVKVFETQDIEEGWIGDTNGGEYYNEPDTYSWVMEIRLSESVEIFRYTGSVVLLR